RAAGGGITLPDLRAYRAEWRPTRSRSMGNLTLHTLPGLLSDVFERQLRGDAAEILSRTGDARWEPRSRAGDAARVVADREGSSVACALTMGAPFGTGQTARATGVLMAPNAPASPYLSALLAVNQNVNETYFAGAAAGGVGAPIALS